MAPMPMPQIYPKKILRERDSTGKCSYGSNAYTSNKCSLNSLLRERKKRSIPGSAVLQVRRGYCKAWRLQQPGRWLCRKHRGGGREEEAGLGDGSTACIGEREEEAHGIERGGKAWHSRYFEERESF
ncbi:hypothetical protein AMTR_s00101p00065890 [Amborella trichopoda]|uniref:Uncharacterized protein n=1 Tax=Amborella trichopoda TaxID=13333 RepID=W1NTZ2_AMBTC|nr:hypothetical protein AMTR_s00101p00065890 [Amborella trichopoda]